MEKNIFYKIMNEEEKDKIDIEDKVEEVSSEENQSQGETTSTDDQSTESSDLSNENNESATESQSIVEEKKENEVIHKKDGRLHIYVRQDKYKGELKSKNWVGRLYIDGKQKISSSGTPNLEQAIPILEKWFDDVHNQKQKELKNLEEQVVTEETKPSETSAQSQVQQTQEIKKQTEQSQTSHQTYMSRHKKRHR